MMNILFVSPHFDILTPNSGAPTREYNLMVQLKNQGNAIIILQSNVHKREGLNKNAYKIYYFNEWHLFGRSTWYFTDFNLDYIFKIQQIIKKENIDIIHVSFPWGVIGCRFISRSIPVVYSAHNVEGDFMKLAVQTEGYPKITKKILPIYAPFQEKLACMSASHIISVSDVDKNIFVKKYGIDKNKITTIPIGIDLDEFKIDGSTSKMKKELGRDVHKKTVIFHGTWSHMPNQSAINSILNFLAPKIQKIDKDTEFVIAGMGVPVFEKDNVKSLGFVKELSPLIQSADIAIAPIFKAAGVRVKILEYLAVGLPVISTKKGIEGINAKNGEEAIIVNDVDEEFINAIEYLMDNEQERERIGRNARRLAEKEYNWEKIGEKLDKLYNKILIGK